MFSLVEDLAVGQPAT